MIKKVLLFFFFTIFCSVLPAQYAKLIYDKSSIGETIDVGQVNCLDIDNDGIEEIIATGKIDSNSRLLIYKWTNGHYDISWAGKLYYENDIRDIKLADLDHDKTFDIYLFLNDGKVDVYDGSARTIKSSFNTGIANLNQVRIDDIDNNGSTEIIAISNSVLSVFDSTFTLKFSNKDLGANDVAVGNIDNDNPKEIVTSTGVVLNALTFEQKWKNPVRFGLKIELADVNQDSVKDIVYIESNAIIAIDGSTHNTLWNISTALNNIRYLQGLYVQDIDKDKINEIIVTSYSDERAACYKPAGSAPIWRFPVNSYYVGKLCVGDPDGDKKNELIFKTYNDYSSIEQLQIMDLASLASEWKSADIKAPFLLSSFDLDSNGSKDLIVAGMKGGYSYQSGLETFDGRSDDLKLRNFQVSSIKSVTAGYLDDISKPKILVGSYGSVIIYNGQTLKEEHTIYVEPRSSEITFVKLADVDKDGRVEIVAATRDGNINICDGSDYSLKSVSPYIGGTLKDLVVANLDDDYSKEAVVLNNKGIIQIYDLKTQHLEWDLKDISDVISIAVSIIKSKPYVIAGRNNGAVDFIDCKTHQVSYEIQAGNNPVTKMLALNLDANSGDELVILNSKIMIFDPETKTLLWSSDPENDKVFSPDNFIAADIDNDRHMELVVSSKYGLYKFKLSAPYIEHVPPYVVSFWPPEGTKSLSINNEIKVIFSKVMDSSKINPSSLIIKTAGDSVVNTSVVYNPAESYAVIKALPRLPSSTSLKVIVSGNITDIDGNSLDGNLNDYSDGDPADNFIWSFSTGSGIDTAGPQILNIKLSSDSVWKGIPLTAEMFISDSSSIAITNVASGEFFIDIPKSTGSGYLLVPKDGSFDSAYEAVSCRIVTDSLLMGSHKLFFHARDSLNNWGPYTIIPVFVRTESLKNWPMLGQNPQHTGYNSFDTLHMPLGLKWSKKVTLPVPSNLELFCYPAVYDDLIYVTQGSFNTNRNEVLALNVNDGSEEWSFSFGQIFSTDSPVAAYGTVFIQTCDNYPGSFVHAFDAKTGRLLWKSNYGAQWQQTSGPIAADGKVFIDGGTYGGMYAFDAFNGKMLWFCRLPQEQNWTPAFYKGSLFVSYTSGPSYYKIDADSGMITDTYGTPWSMGVTPVINNGRIFTSNPVSAIDLKTHETLWSKSGNNIAVTDSQVFIANSTLRAYNELSGKLLWEFAGDGNLKYKPVIASNYVIISSDSNTYAVNLKTMKSEWNYPAGGHVAVANGKIYIYSKNGSIYCFSDDVTSVHENEYSRLNLSYSLGQNYPNPFNPITSIKYQIPEKQHVELKIFDALGREMLILVDEEQNSGTHSVQFNAGNFPSGIYIYTIHAGPYRESKKMIILK